MFTLAFAEVDEDEINGEDGHCSAVVMIMMTMMMLLLMMMMMMMMILRTRFKST